MSKAVTLSVKQLRYAMCEAVMLCVSESIMLCVSESVMLCVSEAVTLRYA